MHEDSDLLCLLLRLVRRSMGNLAVSLSFALALGIHEVAFGCPFGKLILYNIIVHFSGQFFGFCWIS